MTATSRRHRHKRQNMFFHFLSLFDTMCRHSYTLSSKHTYTICNRVKFLLFLLIVVSYILVLLLLLYLLSTHDCVLKSLKSKYQTCWQQNCLHIHYGYSQLSAGSWRECILFTRMHYIQMHVDAYIDALFSDFMFKLMSILLTCQ